MGLRDNYMTASEDWGRQWRSLYEALIPFLEAIDEDELGRLPSKPGNLKILRQCCLSLGFAMVRQGWDFSGLTGEEIKKNVETLAAKLKQPKNINRKTPLNDRVATWLVLLEPYSELEEKSQSDQKNKIESTKIHAQDCLMRVEKEIARLKANSKTFARGHLISDLLSKIQLELAIYGCFKIENSDNYMCSIFIKKCKLLIRDFDHMSDHKKIKYNSSTKKDDISEFTLDEINSLVGSNVLVNGYRGDSFKSLASFLASHAQSKHVIYITEGEITIEPLVESICRTRYCYFISNNYEESNLFNLSFTAPLSFSRDSLFNDDISLMKSCRRRIQMLDELIDLKIDRTCSSFFEEVLFETYRLVGMNSPSDFTRDKFLELLLRDDEDFKYSVPMKIEKRKEFSKKIEGISNGLAGRLFINDQKTLADYNTDTESMVIMDFSGLTKGADNFNPSLYKEYICGCIYNNFC